MIPPFTPVPSLTKQIETLVELKKYAFCQDMVPALNAALDNLVALRLHEEARSRGLIQVNDPMRVGSLFAVNAQNAYKNKQHGTN